MRQSVGPRFHKQTGIDLGFESKLLDVKRDALATCRDCSTTSLNAVGGVLLLLVVLSFALPLRAESFLPPEREVLYIAGQDRESIQEYVDRVCARGRECPMPAALSFYTSLSLSGIDGPQANLPGDNHQDFAFVLRQSRTMALHIGLYLSKNELAPVGRGEFDSVIDRLAKVIRDTGRVTYLRIGYEFDGPHNAYDPAAYRAAYRHIVDRFRSAAVANVAYIWHSYARAGTYGSHDLMDWYPGDQYVDWVGISYFWNEPEARERVVKIARAKKLPLMICEASAIRPSAEYKKLQAQAYWDYWYEPFFRFVENTPEVRAFSIITCNWDAQKQFASLQWGDARLSVDPVVLRNWRARVKSSRFVHDGAQLPGVLSRGGKTRRQR